MSDNKIALSYINNMGGIKSLPCHIIAKDIWLRCKNNNIWVSAAHRLGKHNIVTDKMSRCLMILLNGN